MGFSLINIDMGDETVPKSITAAHAFWDDVYTRSPFLGPFSLVIGIMLNKVSKIPSYTLLASTIITKLIALKLRIRHAH